MPISPKDAVLARAKLALDSMVEKAKNQRNEEDRRFLVSKIGEDLAVILVPLLEEIASNARLSRDDISGLINSIKTEIAKVQVEIPEIKMPDIFVPEPKVTVNVPEIKLPIFKVPEIKMPDEMNIKGWVSLMGVDLEHPLPVQLRNADGSPFNPFEKLTTILTSGGGFAKHVKIDGTVPVSAGESLLVNQVSGANWSVSVADTVTVSQLSGATDSVNVVTTVGLTDTQLRASSVPVIQVSGAIDSVSVIGTVPVSVADTLGVNQVSGANWSVTATQGTSPWVVSATDLDVRDLNVGQDEMLVHQVSGANWSVNVPGTVTVSATDLDIRDLANATDSISVYQVSGASWSVNTGTVTVTATDLDIRDLANTTDSVAVYQVSGATWSVNVISDAIALTDTQLRASSVPVSQVSGSIDSTNVVQLGGTAIATDIGDVSAGTQRIYIARSPNATTAAVSVGADASTSIVPTSVGRKSIIITHTSSSNLYLATGAAVSTTSMPIVANQIVGFDDYTGPVNAIAEEAAGTISVRYIEVD